MNKTDELWETDSPATQSPKRPGTQYPKLGSAMRRGSTGFLIVGSALVGATAIALWNRRAIARLRAEIRANRPEVIDDTESEIV